MEQLYFRWPDYLVLCIILALSAVIGFYYAFTGNKQSTTKEYLLAGKKMHWFPVACSLVARYVILYFIYCKAKARISNKNCSCY